MSDQPRQLSIQALLGGGVDYVVPMYQRNYAWEEGEITQLIQDVIDSLPKAHEHARNYYLGSLVVYRRASQCSTPMFETIDGQQRLTTLSLLASHLKNTSGVDLAWYSTLRLHFESRENSRATCAAIFEGGFNHDSAERLTEKQINTGILNGYRLIQKVLPQKLKEHGVSPQQFADYLFNYVQILRVPVPQETDLNHYFEIMNTRGEQLEKHEVLKARMMKTLNGCKQSERCLDTVWNACANMEHYVQLGFESSLRERIFRDQGQLKLAGFDELAAVLQPAQQVPTEGNGSTLLELITRAPKGAGQEETDDDSPERFNSVINFPNFLLHVLCVDTRAEFPLNDKGLLETFDTYVLKQPDPAAAVRGFTFSLLRCKVLLDQYVIKREFNKNAEGWSLKRYKWDAGGTGKPGRGSYVNTFGDEQSSEALNRRILMLLSAFHVSHPTQDYKYWLSAALHHLFYARQVDAQAYLLQMESVAKAFIFDRLLAPEPGLRYADIILENQGVCQTRRHSIDEVLLEPRLRFGKVSNLVFNFLDYLLWLEYRASEPVKSYEFTFRSSVEHYYPQHPMEGQAQLETTALHAFGNLCLISHEKNSRLSNFMPQAKKEFYKNTAIESVKQHLMLKVERWEGDDAVKAINSHQEEMVSVLLSSLDS